MLKSLCLAAALALAAAALANGLFMLVAPADWYFAVPGVTTTGPFNPHFVRDIGLIFLFIGAALAAGAAFAHLRIVAWGASAAWLAGHALFHLWEVAVGICAPRDLVRDFPAVSLPALLALLLTLWAIIDARRSSRAAARA